MPDSILLFFNPLARSPHAAEISAPRDLRMEAEIPETVRLCLK